MVGGIPNGLETIAGSLFCEIERSFSVNPYKPPNIPSGNQASDKSDQTNLKSAGLETWSIVFGTMFLAIVIPLSILRENHFRSGEAETLWMSDLRSAPIVGVIGAALCTFLLIQLLALGKRLFARTYLKNKFDSRI